MFFSFERLNVHGILLPWQIYTLKNSYEIEYEKIKKQLSDRP